MSPRLLQGIRLAALLAGGALLLAVVTGLAGHGLGGDLLWGAAVLLLGVSLLANRVLKRHEPGNAATPPEPRPPD